MTGLSGVKREYLWTQTQLQMNENIAPQEFLFNKFVILDENEYVSYVCK